MPVVTPLERSRYEGTSPIMATTGVPSMEATTVPAAILVPATGDETVTEVVKPSVAVVWL